MPPSTRLPRSRGEMSSTPLFRSWPLPKSLTAPQAVLTASELRRDVDEGMVPQGLTARCIAIERHSCCWGLRSPRYLRRTRLGVPRDERDARALHRALASRGSASTHPARCARSPAAPRLGPLSFAGFARTRESVRKNPEALAEYERTIVTANLIRESARIGRHAPGAASMRLVASPGNVPCASSAALLIPSASASSDSSDGSVCHAGRA
jgi:hypothetical protein